MNLLPLLLGFVLFGTFNKRDKQQAFDLSQILSNPDIANLLPHVAKLFDKTANEEDKNFAIMNLLTNPAIFEIMQKFSTTQQKTTQQNDDNTKETVDLSKENDNQPKQEFSDESKEFFAPIQEVAGKQISKKLYALYDNWYVKK